MGTISSASKTRMYYIDLAKGILILFLVFHHYLSASRRIGIGGDEYIKAISQWQICITPFFMGAFFFITGFCSNFNKDARSFFANTIKTIIIPWLVWDSVIRLSIYPIFHNEESISGYYNLPGFFFETFVWFLQAMAWCRILYYLICHFVSRYSYRLFIAIIIGIFGIAAHQYELFPNVLRVQEGMYALTFLAIGNVLKNHPQWYDRLLKVGAITYPLILIGVMLFFHVPIFVAGMNISLVTYAPSVLLSVSGTLLLLSVCRKIGRNSLIEYFGQHSIIVYVTHIILLMYTMYMVNRFIVSPDTMLHTVLFTIISYIIEYLLCYLAIKCMQCKYLSWMVGK